MTTRICRSKDAPTLIKPPKAASGFDVQATKVGDSIWVGADGMKVGVHYQTSLGSALAQDILLNRIDGIMADCDAVFGVKGQGGNVIIIRGNGGAYHYGCTFRDGGDWYEDDMGLTHPPPAGSPGGLTAGLVMAEVSESYMGLQNKGWNCGGSGGEALSRVLAERASGGIYGAMSGGFDARSSWDGRDWISRDQGTDGDYPSIGCGMLYLDWVRKLGFTIDQIVQAGEPDGTLASNYKVLTGKASAWLDFKGAVAGLDINVTNPFGIVDGPYPLTGTTPPPPPPVCPAGQHWDPVAQACVLDGTPPPPPPPPPPPRPQVVTIPALAVHGGPFGRLIGHTAPITVPVTAGVSETDAFKLLLPMVESFDIGGGWLKALLALLKQGLPIFCAIAPTLPIPPQYQVWITLICSLVPKPPVPPAHATVPCGC